MLRVTIATGETVDDYYWHKLYNSKRLGAIRKQQCNKHHRTFAMLSTDNGIIGLLTVFRKYSGTFLIMNT